jgi:two-component system, cell cycle response regulator CtrA
MTLEANMNILLIGSDGDGELATILRRHDLSVSVAGAGEDLADLAARAEIVLIEVPRAYREATGVLRSLRASGVATPVVMIFGLAGVDLTVQALRVGADDCIFAPFHREELLARMHAVARRFRVRERPLVSNGNVVADLECKTVEVGGVGVRVSIKEFEILEYLMRGRGAVLTKGALIQHLYNGQDEPDQKILDVFVCKLRKKIGDANGGRNPIETVRGLGYRWRDCDDAMAA